ADGAMAAVAAEAAVTQGLALGLSAADRAARLRLECLDAASELLGRLREKTNERGLSAQDIRALATALRELSPMGHEALASGDPYLQRDTRSATIIDVACSPYRPPAA